MIIELRPNTTVLELLEHHPEREAVFSCYSKRIGVCLCCEALFATLTEIALRYELNLDELLARLNSVME